MLRLLYSLTNIEILNIIRYRINYDRVLIYYRKKNVQIGQNSILYSVKVSNSYKGDNFVIGKNCCLTGCTLLGHDASPATFLSVLVNDKRVYMPGSRKSYRSVINIGDNVFVGTGAIILPGVTIGSNVIIGAGSIVTKDIPANSVFAGNPAKEIMSLEDYKDKYLELYKANPELF